MCERGRGIYYTIQHNNEKAAPELGIREGLALSKMGVPMTRLVSDTGPLVPRPRIVLSHSQSDSPFPVNTENEIPQLRLLQHV